MDQHVIPMSQWMRKSNMKFFSRLDAAVVVEDPIPLAHDQVVRVLSATFESLSRDAHYITIAARVILADRVSAKIFKEDEVFKAEEEINRQLERANDWLDRRLIQAQQRLSAAGYDAAAVIARRKAKLYETKRTTRTVKDFLEIAIKADNYLTLHDYLWIEGELSDTPAEALRAKLNNEREVRTQLQGIAKKAAQHFTVINRICREVLSERQQARAAQAERDRAAALARKAAGPNVENAQADLDRVGKPKAGGGKRRKTVETESVVTPIITDGSQQPSVEMVSQAVAG